MSKRADQVDEFEAKRNTDAILQECAGCGELLYYRQMDRHHPAGKHGTNILKYVYLCRTCHREVHDDPKVATRRGLLWTKRNIRDITDIEWTDLLAKIKENQYRL